MTDVETDVAAIAAWLSNNGAGLAEGAIFYYHGGQLVGLPIAGSAGKFLISNGTDPSSGHDAYEPDAHHAGSRYAGIRRAHQLHRYRRQLDGR